MCVHIIACLTCRFRCRQEAPSHQDPPSKKSLSFIWCESLGRGCLVPRRNDPGFVQRKVQEKSDFSVGSVLEYYDFYLLIFEIFLKRRNI